MTCVLRTVFLFFVCSCDRAVLVYNVYLIYRVTYIAVAPSCPGVSGIDFILLLFITIQRSLPRSEVRLFKYYRRLNFSILRGFEGSVFILLKTVGLHPSGKKPTPNTADLFIFFVNRSYILHLLYTPLFRYL